VRWWQDPGYHTAGYFTRFGRALVDPLFSGLGSFGDGLYSTMFADGLCGGRPGLLCRTPWNYELMTAGCLLAIVAVVLVLAGVMGAIVRMLMRSGKFSLRAGPLTPALSPSEVPLDRDFSPRENCRHPEDEGSESRSAVAADKNSDESRAGVGAPILILLGFSLAMGLAIVHLNLEVPIYGEAKAFFGLSALLPLSVFAAIGWRSIEKRPRYIRAVTAGAMAAWAIVSYSSLWIRGETSAAQVAVGRELMDQGNLADAVPHLRNALRGEPEHQGARAFLLEAMTRENRLAEAEQLAELGLKAHPDSAARQIELAAVLEAEGNMTEALQHTWRAVEMAEDEPEARLRLAARLFKTGRYKLAIPACREALRLTPSDPEPHNLLAYALLAEARLPQASIECVSEDCLTLDLNLNLSPNLTLDHASPSAPPYSARDLLTAAASSHLHLLVKLAPRSPDPLETLAWTLATYPRAELRDGREAVELAQRACALTQNPGAQRLATLAAAWAETGEFAKALEVTAKAQAKVAGKDALEQRIAKMKKGFEGKQAYREF
jgi:tetratricopeptide (TPR) repeat protein